MRSQRLLLTVACGITALGLVACDRTDHDFGDDGVARIGVSADQIIPVPGGEAVQQTIVVGHRPATSTILVSTVDQEGRTLSTAALPTSVTSPNVHAAVVGWGEPRDPDIKVDVAGIDATGHVAVAQTIGDAVNHDYGTDGVASIDVTPDANTAPLIAATDDGSATVVAQQTGHPVVTQLSSDGQVVSTRTMDQDLEIQAVQALEDGRTLAAGVAVVTRRGDGLAIRTDFAVLRFQHDGSLDPSFGTNGITKISFGDIDRANSVLLTSTGGHDRILIGGTTSSGVKADVALASLTPDGALDGSFGLYARTITDPHQSIERVDLAAGTNHIIALMKTDDTLQTIGYDERGVLDDAWGDHGLQRRTLGGAVSPAGIRALSLRCLHGVCTDDWRFLIGARTGPAPGGALLRLLD